MRAREVSTGSRFMGVECVPDIEDAWTYGGNLTVYFKLGYGEDAYFSFDYFKTRSVRQTRYRYCVIFINCHYTI